MASRLSNFIVRHSAIGQAQVQNSFRAISNASNMTTKDFVRGTFTMQNATKKQITTLQALERTYAKAMLPGVKTFGGLLNNIQNVSQALKYQTVAGRATGRSIMNMSKNAQTYTANARGMLTNMQKMRVMSHALGTNITSLSNHYKALGTKMQWTGRQMIIGLSAPMALGATVAVKSWNKVNDELTRLKKVISAEEFKKLGGGRTTKEATDGILKAAKQLGHEFAVVDEMVLAVMADFAAMGYVTRKELMGMTELSLKMSSLGDVDIADATKAVRTVMEQFGGTIDKTTDILAAFNAIENDTALGLRDLVPSFPQVAAAAEAFGLSAQETVSAMAAMYEQGIPASEVAHALKYALTSLISPTKETADMVVRLQRELPEVGNTLAAIADGGLRGREGLVAFAKAYKDLSSAKGRTEAEKMLVSIVGKRQVARIGALFKSINLGEKELATKNSRNVADYTSDWARATKATGTEFETLKTNRERMERELQVRQRSDAFKYKQAIRDIKSEIAGLGQEIAPVLQGIAIAIGNMMKTFGDFIEQNPGFKKFLVTAGLFLAVLGPLVSALAIGGIATATIAGGIAKLFPKLGYAASGFLNLTDAAYKASRTMMVDVGGALFTTNSNFSQNIKKIKELILGTKAVETASAASAASRGKEVAAVTASTRAYQANTVAISENVAAQVSALYGGAAASAAAATKTAQATQSATASTQAANAAIAASFLGTPARGLAKTKEVAKSSKTAVANAMKRSMRRVPVAPPVVPDLTPAQRYAAGVERTKETMDRRYGYASPLAKADRMAQQAERRRLVNTQRFRSRLRIGRQRLVQPPPVLPHVSGVRTVGEVTAIDASRYMAVSPNKPSVEMAMRQSMQGKQMSAAARRNAAMQAAMFVPPTLPGKDVAKRKGLLPSILRGTSKVTGAEKPGIFAKVLRPLETGVLKVFNRIPAGGLMAKLFGGAGAKLGILTSVGGALTSMGSAVAGIAAAAGPVLLVVAAIAGLLAILAAVSGHWDKFVEGLKAGIKPAIGILKSAFNDLKSAVMSIFGVVKALIRPFTDIIGEIFGLLSGEGKGGKASQGKGWKLIGTLIGGIGTALAAVIKMLTFSIKITAKFIEIIAKVIGFGIKLALMFNPFIIGIKMVARGIGSLIKQIGGMKEVWRAIANAVIGYINSIIGAINSVTKAAKNMLVSLMKTILDIAKAINAIPIIGESIISDDAIKNLEETIKKIQGTDVTIGVIPEVRKSVEGKELEKMIQDIIPVGGGSTGQQMIDQFKSLTTKLADLKKAARKTQDEQERADIQAQMATIEGQISVHLRKIYSSLPEEAQKRIKRGKFEQIMIKRFADAGFKSGTKFKRSVQDILEQRPEEFVPVFVRDEAAEEAAQKFSDAFKDKLSDQVEKIRDEATAAFEAMSKAKLQVFDDQIKAIEAVENAEKELFETEKYLQDRRKLLQNQQTNAENYRRNRALAIYEGRYDDARMMDLEFQKSSQENSEELKSLDDERNQTLLQKERDAQKARIEEQKKALEEQLNIQKKAFDDQLALITEYTPKNLAELTNMIDAINGLLGGYGAQTFSDSWGRATSVWSTATEKAGRDVAEEAYWAGVGAAQAAERGILQKNPEYEEYMKNLSKEEQRRLLKYQSIQSQRGGFVNNLVDFADLGFNVDALVAHKGGMIGNLGSTAADVPAVLQTGEYVIQRKAVNKLGMGFLNSINKYHEGGPVGKAMDTHLGSLAAQKLMMFMAGVGTYGGMTMDQVNAMYAAKRNFNALIGTGVTGAEAQPLQLPVDKTNLIVTSFQHLLAKVFPEAARSILSGSTYREGPMVSFHASGQALDIGDALAGQDALSNIFGFLADRVEKFDIVELIFRNMQFDKGPGWREYGGNDHYDHIHVAIGRRLEESINTIPNFFRPLMRGGKIPLDNFPALLHKGEVVLPANIVRNLEQSSQNGGGDTYICVDTFIGQRQWFESMMKEYNIKTLPAEQRRRGTMNRVVSSRKDNTVRYV